METFHHQAACCARNPQQNFIGELFMQIPCSWIRFGARKAEGMEHKKTYCVTGGGGYLGSWLIKTLLDRGYTVHATLRDPENPDKAGPLKSLKGAEERLRLFKADLVEENSFDEAVEGCQGVFHVASPVGLYGQSMEEEVVIPAVKGVANLFKSCKRSQTVKKVVVTSSMGAACPLSDRGELIGCIDETRWSPIQFLKQCKEPLAMYWVSKVLEEQAALKFGEEHKNEIEVITMLPAIVVGPFITSDLPESCAFLLCFFTGDKEQLHRMMVCQQFLGSLPLVHTEDVCNAHIFVMQHPSAQGRYICSSVVVSAFQLSDYLANQFPNLPSKLQVKKEEDGDKTAGASSQKLIDMGFEFKHGLHDILADSISAAVAHGTLQNT